MPHCYKTTKLPLPLLNVKSHSVHWGIVYISIHLYIGHAAQIKHFYTIYLLYVMYVNLPNK